MTMENCFVCDSYFYRVNEIKEETSVDSNSETGVNYDVLDSSNVTQFCESMDISSLPENIGQQTVVPLCHRCSIASSKILLLQEQIAHLKNQVSQLQYSLAEKALLTYYNNKEENSCEEELEAESSPMDCIRKLLRYRWEEPGDKYENVNSVDCMTEEDNEDSCTTNENSASVFGEREDETPATKRPASFEWSQNIRKKNQTESLEPNILYVNLGNQSNVINNQGPVFSIGEASNPTENEYVDNEEQEEEWGDEVQISVNGEAVEMESADYEEDDDVIVESESIPSNSNSFRSPHCPPPPPALTRFQAQGISSVMLPGSTKLSPGLPILKTYSKFPVTQNRNSQPLPNTSASKNKVRVCLIENCGKEFRNLDRFTEHVNVHNGNAPSCDICKKVFPRKYNLRIHMRTHTGEKPHKCPICYQQYADKSNLNAHIRKHYERPFHCSICRRMFDDITSAQSHIAAFHPDRKERNLIRLTRLIPKVPK